MRKTEPLQQPYSQIEAIKANDEQALELLYTANFKSVERYILDNSGSADEAKDIYQEAFVAVWRNVQLGSVVVKEGSSLNGYLFQVAKYKWLDHLRTARVKRTVPLQESHEEQYDNGEPGNEDREKLERVKEGFGQLGEKCRNLLEAFYYRKYSIRKIADLFKWTEATAKNNKYRCLEKLRESIINKTSKP